ncbi:MAG: polyribonucleotide nucleotidyltransferase, partial [Solirubrobacterales bacterium]
STVEEVINRGDELHVKVVEVDRERGRIGLRLSSDPAVQGKVPEELANVGTGDPGPRGGREGGGRRGRERLDGGRERGRSGSRRH